MTSFSIVLMEEGVEVELPANMADVIEILDREVPCFSREGFGFRVTPAKVHVGTRWDLMVNLVHPASQEPVPAPLGRIELKTLDANAVQLRIPPRAEAMLPAAVQVDPDGGFLGSFICQMLNTLQRHRLIDLPGTLPVA